MVYKLNPILLLHVSAGHAVCTSGPAHYTRGYGSPRRKPAEKSRPKVCPQS